MREGLHKIPSEDETIVAIATPLGQSGIGVVRVSGEKSTEILKEFFRSASKVRVRVAVLGSWITGRSEELDQVIVTFFKGPASYTGEDVIEISAHGNPLVLRRIVNDVCAAGARVARPGEFTLRAVSRGKIDLIQAEAVRDFVEAQTEQQAKIARRQMEGAISNRIRPAKEGLIDVIANLEAAVDFAEDDVDVPSNDSLTRRIRPIREQFERLAETFDYGKILFGGLRVAIAGKPNVGKSSLFNKLLSKERAIVTDVPGTTRDVLTETIDLDGVPVCFADTAGIRETNDAVESIGIARTCETLSDADLTLVVFDASRPWEHEDDRVMERAKQIPHITVINKTDLPRLLSTDRLSGSRRLDVSATNGQGLDDLCAAIREFLLAQRDGFADEVILTNARQCEALIHAAKKLADAERSLASAVPHEMVLIELYSALEAMNELTGDVVTEDILDRIFSTFCIGK